MSGLTLEPVSAPLPANRVAGRGGFLLGQVGAKFPTPRQAGPRIPRSGIGVFPRHAPAICGVLSKFLGWNDHVDLKVFHTNTKRPDAASVPGALVPAATGRKLAASVAGWLREKKPVAAGEAKGRASSDADHARTAAAQGERMREIAGRPPARNEIDKRLEEGSA